MLLSPTVNNFDMKKYLISLLTLIL